MKDKESIYYFLLSDFVRVKFGADLFVELMSYDYRLLEKFNTSTKNEKY